MTRAHVDDLVANGIDDGQIEAAVGVVAMFNYFTRVADATGIDFDYPSPLPAFEPDRCQIRTPRPPEAPSGRTAVEPQLQVLRDAWTTWREYVLESGQPIGRRERRLVAATAAEESADREGDVDPGTAAECRLVEFARAVSRRPWTMGPADLEELRSCGYSDLAILHVISVTAHQNATSRLRAGLAAARA